MLTHQEEIDLGQSFNLATKILTELTKTGQNLDTETLLITLPTLTLRLIEKKQQTRQEIERINNNMRRIQCNTTKTQ